MKTIEQELRIEYIGPEGLSYWHGKLSTLKKTIPLPIIMSQERITPKLYENG